MRHNTLKVREMIAGPDVPYRKDGGPALCHGCQRSVYFKGGIVLLLAKEVARQSRYRYAPSRDTSKATGNLPEPTDDENVAYQRFVDWRWPDGVCCPKCNAPHPYFITTVRRFKCRECKTQFTPTTGTVFSNKKLSYVTAIKLLNSTTDNAMQLSRDTGLTYKTAWSMMKRMQSHVRTR